MSIEDCARAIKSEYKLDLSFDEVKGIVQEANRAITTMRGARSSVPKGEVLKWAKNQTVNQDREMLIKIRNAAFDKLGRENIRSNLHTLMESKREGGKWIIGKRPMSAMEAFRGIIEGVESVTSNSALAHAEANFSRYAAKLIDIKKLGKAVEKRFVNGDMDDDIARVLWELDTGVKSKQEVEPDARAVGEILHALQSAMMADLNANGGHIRKLDTGYIMQQMHDMDKIRGPAFGDKAEARKAWVDYVLERIDFEKSFNYTRDQFDTDPDVRAAVIEKLESTWKNLESGVHAATGDPLRGSSGGSNVANKVSQQRHIIFRDADAFMQYQRQYGRDRLFDGVMLQIRNTARSNAVLKNFGPNFKKNILESRELLARELRDAGHGEEAEQLMSTTFTRDLDDLMDEMDGSAQVPSHPNFAKINSAIRKMNSWALLGSTALTMLGDAPVMGGEARLQGAGLFSGEANWLRSVARTFSEDLDEKQAAMALGVAAEVIHSAKLDVFGSQEYHSVGKLMAGIDNTFRRLSLFQQITERVRVGNTIMWAQYMGSQKDVAFGSLKPGHRKVLEIAGIEEAEWDLLRQGVETRDIRGRQTTMLTWEGVRSLSEDAVDDYLRKTGQIVEGERGSGFKRRRAVESIIDKMSSYFLDSVRSSQIEAKPELTRQMRMKTNPGTAMHAILSHLAQFKTWSIGMAKQRLSRDVAVRRQFTPEEKSASGLMASSPAFAAAALIVEMTVAGYAIQAMKDIAKNRTPLEPDDPKAWASSFMTGGGLGFYGDFIFAETDRYGQGAVQSLLGPTVRTFDGLQGFIGRAVHGGAKGNWDAANEAKEAIRLIHNHMPLNNLFYSRAALDYFIMYNIYEHIKPGYMRDNLRRLERETGQSLIFGSAP